VGEYWYDTGEKVQISAFPVGGYGFDNWTGSGLGSYTGYDSTETVTIEGPITETAYFSSAVTVTEVDITFSASGLTIQASGPVLTVDGAGYRYSDLPKTFTWQVGSSHSFEWTSLVPADQSIRYLWTSTTGLSTERTGSIIVPSVNSSVQATYGTQYYLAVSSLYGSPTGEGWYDAGSTASSSVTSPVPTGTGTRYICTGWTGTGSAPPSGTGTSVNFTINSSSTVNWVWEAEYRLRIQVSPSGAGSTAPTVGEHWYGEGETVQISASSLGEYGFDNWTGSGSGSYTGYDSTATITMNAPIVETAHFYPGGIVTEVDVTFSASGLGGDASGSVLTVDGATYGYTDLPKTFIWTPGSQHVFEWTFIVPAGSEVRYVWTSTSGLSTARNGSIIIPRVDSPIQASYKTQYYANVTTDYGTAEPATGWFDGGTNVTLSVTPTIPVMTGVRYACTSWTGTGSAPSSGTGTTVTFNLTAPSTLTYNWETQYYLTVESPHGTATGEGWYNAGSWATISVEESVPMEGLLGIFGVRWVFLQWTGDLTSISPTTNIPMDSPKQVLAIWREDYLLLILLMLLMQIFVLVATVSRWLYQRAKGNEPKQNEYPQLVSSGRLNQRAKGNEPKQDYPQLVSSGRLNQRAKGNEPKQT
jgi:hypothetical protein